MIKGMTEAVAALLYNEIYDLTPMEGAWTVEDPRDDRSYLAFAEQLVKVIESNPDADDATIISQAKYATNRSKASPHGWDTVVIDEKYSSLCEHADKHMPQIRAFIADPNPMFFESEFLQYDEDGNYARG